jgi:hypothetical protein
MGLSVAEPLTCGSMSELNCPVSELNSVVGYQLVSTGELLVQWRKNPHGWSQKCFELSDEFNRRKWFAFSCYIQIGRGNLYLI